MATRTFADTLTEVSAVAHAKVPESWHSRLEMATALVSHGAVFAEDDGVHISVRSRSNPEHWWAVNGACPCADAQEKAPKGHCAHRLAAILYLRTSERMLEPVEDGLASPEAESVSQEVQSGKRQIPAHYIEHLKTSGNKPFIKYVGLLQMAHDEGLTSLEAHWTLNEAELSLAEAVAVFHDGRHFTECGDSTPQSAKNIGLHWRRMSLTRAKARVLRDALAIDLCSIEEME